MVTKLELDSIPNHVTPEDVMLTLQTLDAALDNPSPSPPYQQTSLPSVNLIPTYTYYSSSASSSSSLSFSTSWDDLLFNITSLDIGNGTYVDEGPVFPEYIKIVSTVFCSIVFVVGVIGNVLVPVVILKNRDMRNSTNCFLINLSFADLLVLLICLPTVLVELHTSPDIWVLGYTMCKIVPYVETSVVHASSLSLFVISLERYHVICRPLQVSYRCTKTKAITAIFIIWILAFLSAGPTLLQVEFQYTTFRDGTVNPSCINVIESLWSRCYIVATSILFFFLPLLVLVGVYTVIARQLLVDTYDLTHNEENPQMRARRQVVVMLATVVLFFFLCLMPMRVFLLWILTVSTETVRALGLEGFYNLLYFCRVMYYINSSINPILYNMTSTKFRTAFLKVFSKKQGRLYRQDTCSNTSYNNHTITNNLRLHYGTNCSMVYKTVYSKSVVSHQYSYTSTGSASSQFTRQSLVTSSGRTSTKDSYV
ncbi:growth hormone secretagogue receptor type 1-like [Palaemon carinicauda]|uniref:growth hormone secretagogue receptor type 1-like n=1 Tax=Palaemon carinicauda TaxID=392227 RepID=UPI0035B64711